MNHLSPSYPTYNVLKLVFDAIVPTLCLAEENAKFEKMVMDPWEQRGYYPEFPEFIVLGDKKLDPDDLSDAIDQIDSVRHVAYPDYMVREQLFERSYFFDNGAIGTIVTFSVEDNTIYFMSIKNVVSDIFHMIINAVLSTQEREMIKDKVDDAITDIIAELTESTLALKVDQSYRSILTDMVIAKIKQLI